MFGRLDLISILMGIFFSILWSSAFSTAKIIIFQIQPFTALAIRFGISAVIAMGIACALGQSFRLTRKQLYGVLIFGVCQNGIYLSANFVAMQWIDASLAAIIASSLPLQVAFLSLWIFRENLGWVGNSGLILGFIGVIIIMATRGNIGLELFGIIICVVASMALCIATLAIKGTDLQQNLMMLVGFQMVVGFVCTLIPALLIESWQPVEFNWPLAMAFTYQIFAPGILGTWIWFLLVNRTGPTKAASFHFLNPFLGVLIAVILLGEAVNATDIFGVIIISLGIVAVQLSKNAALPDSKIDNS